MLEITGITGLQKHICIHAKLSECDNSTVIMKENKLKRHNIA